MLAEIGVASAHPGGPALTRFWYSKVDWSKTHDILEVGCGTGRTLTEICQLHQCSATGVDVRPTMVQKARKRARQLGVNDLRFLVSGAEKLPFKEDSFDLVFTESVNVFLDDPAAAMGEYARVLCADGIYIDVEMLVMQPVNEMWREGVKRVYGAKFVPDMVGWKRMYKQAGFSSVEVLTTRSVDPMTMSEASAGNEQGADLTSPGAYQRPDVLAALHANADWMENNYRPLGYGVFLCRV